MQESLARKWLKLNTGKFNLHFCLYARLKKNLPGGWPTLRFN